MVDVEAFHKNLGDMLVASRRCIDLRQYLPALTLMYTLIDSLAWAAAQEQPSVRKRFENWVDRWLIPHLERTVPKINSTDVYAARCAVLHTLTGDSDLSRAGEARRVLYASGAANIETLRSAIRDGDLPGHVAMHFEELFTALFRALEQFLEAANHDPVLTERLDAAACRHYVNVAAETLSGNEKA